jgi:type VI secretion system ImpM family protein
MFSFFNKKSPILSFKQIRLFGKLPGFADFVRFRSADPEAVNFDSWMQQGFNQSLENPWALNICQEINHSYHLATALNSQDKSGRKYPLVLLAEVENSWLNDYKPSFPLIFKTLQDFGISLQQDSIDSQKKLIEAINHFEKSKWPLSKCDLLEQRIQALKKLTQNQSWGKWCAKQEGLDLCDWKIKQVLSMRTQNTFEFPLGSDYSAEESSYWLQLLDDIREVKHNALNYYCLHSQRTKKIVIDLGNSELPALQSLFKPFRAESVKVSEGSDRIFNGELDLLVAANYWKQVSV